MMVAMGVLVTGVGSILSFSEEMATGYVQHTFRGRFWARVLGEQRAIAAMQRVFGPFAILIGLAVVGIAMWFRIGAQ